MTQGYLLAWAVHTLAAAALLAVVFRVTRRWRPVALQLVLRTLAVVWLFMPAVVDPDVPDPWMAPAFIVILFEGWASPDAALRVLQPLLALSAVAVAVVLAAHWAWMRHRGRQAESLGPGSTD